MMKKQTVVYFTLFAFARLTTTQAQTQLHVTNGCNYYGEENETDYYQFEPTSEARQIVNELLQGSSLSSSSFRLKESNCKNALATMVNGVRYILYNPDFLRKFKQDANTKWAAYGVLAHEIGHHLNGHNLSESNPSVCKQYELEADKFAGGLLFHLHATVDEAQAGIRTIPLEGETNTHPPKSARLVATTNGWTAAYDLNRGIQPKAVEQSSVGNEALAEEWLDKAAHADNENDAIKYTDKAIELNPRSGRAMLMRGSNKLYLNNQYHEAILDFDQAIKLGTPDEITYMVFSERGEAKEKIGLIREAIADYDQAIRLKPDYTGAINRRGDAKYALGQYVGAIEDYSLAIRLDPTFALAYINKGCCIVQMNDKSRLHEAINLIDKGLSLHSSFTWAKDCKTEALKRLKE